MTQGFQGHARCSCGETFPVHIGFDGPYRYFVGGACLKFGLVPGHKSVRSDYESSIRDAEALLIAKYHGREV